MAEIKKYIAVDLGAESGRVMLGSVSTRKLILEEIHRFSNGPIEENGSLRWDFNKLLSEIKSGIAKASKAASAQIWGIGVDSWGVDFGLLNVDGKLIENPYRCSTFPYSSHIGYRYLWRYHRDHMDMVRSYIKLNDFHMLLLCKRPKTMLHLDADLTIQEAVTIFRSPYHMELTVPYGMR